MSIDQRCAIVHKAIREAVGGQVAFGPFAGMRMAGGPQFYYLLGTYECELHPVIYGLAGHRFAHIINVGACDGYYAVGLGLQHPEAQISAYESDEQSQATLAMIAQLNGIQNRFEVHGRCVPSDLNKSVGAGTGCLIFMDCEGDEDKLLDPTAIAGLRNCHIIVELHEFKDAKMGDKMRERFGYSHDIEEVWAHIRTLEDLPFQPAAEVYTDELKPYYVYSIDENRPSKMRWFCMEPKYS